MNRELALKIVLALVGLLFVALGYPMVVFIRQEPALSMMLSLYVTLGVFLILAIRNPSGSRSLIAFTAWSSFAHASLMGTQGISKHGRTRGTDWGGGPCDDRSSLSRARASDTASGVRVASEPTSITLTDGEGSRNIN